MYLNNIKLFDSKNKMTMQKCGRCLLQNLEKTKLLHKPFLDNSIYDPLQ